MYSDTHFHIEPHQKEVLDRALDAGVCLLIASCCDASSMKSYASLLALVPHLFLTMGFHPSEATSVSLDDWHFLEDAIKQNPRIVGIGEIGLDYHYGTEDRLAQIELFRRQLSMAVENNKPVVIHSRDATEETISILKEYPVKGIIHCFSGSVETAKEYIKMGFLLGIGGVVTFSNSKLYQVVESIPLSSIVLETDSPYLAPVPYRGMENEPQYIPVIAQKISTILGISIEDVATITTGNACSLFDLSAQI